MSNSRWIKGLDKDEKERLVRATSQDDYILPRVRTILEEDLASSVKNMRKQEVCIDHGLLLKEIALQQECAKLIEMINQIIKEKDA